MALYRVTIGPADVGRRVVVRRSLEVSGQPPYGDVLGELTSWADDALVVTRADGSPVEVALADVVSAKAVPPAAIRPWPPDLVIEEAASLGWPGLEQHWVGGWLLRAGGGFTGRANSALPLGEPGGSLDEVLAQVQEWYADRGLRAQLQVPLPARAELDAELEARGWRAHNGARVLVGRLAEVLALTAPGPAVRLSPDVDEAWLAAYHYRGGALPPHGVEVIRRGPGLVFASVLDDDGSALAIGRGSVAEGWLGLTAIETVERARRRGLATAVVRALVEHAIAHGADRCYLQVAAENAAAMALYARTGFVDHHGYHYREAPA